MNRKLCLLSPFAILLVQPCLGTSLILKPLPCGMICKHSRELYFCSQGFMKFIASSMLPRPCIGEKVHIFRIHSHYQQGEFLSCSLLIYKFEELYIFSRCDSSFGKLQSVNDERKGLLAFQAKRQQTYTKCTGEGFTPAIQNCVTLYTKFCK